MLKNNWKVWQNNNWIDHYNKENIIIRNETDIHNIGKYLTDNHYQKNTVVFIIFFSNKLHSKTYFQLTYYRTSNNINEYTLYPSIIHFNWNKIKELISTKAKYIKGVKENITTLFNKYNYSKIIEDDFNIYTNNIKKIQEKKELNLENKKNKINNLKEKAVRLMFSESDKDKRIKTNQITLFDIKKLKNKETLFNTDGYKEIYITKMNNKYYIFSKNLEDGLSIFIEGMKYFYNNTLIIKTCEEAFEYIKKEF